MSAIIVLILRILLVVIIYTFLGLTLFVLWRELQKTSKDQEKLAHPKISFEIDGKDDRSFVQSEIQIGRGVNNDIQIEEEVVSQQHARVYFFHNHWMIEDCQSTNGTFLNGEIIHAPTVIIEGDRIDIGNTTLEVLIDVEQKAT